MIDNRYMSKDQEEVKEYIRQSYTKVALEGASSGCCGDSCCCSCAPGNANEANLTLGYTEEELLAAPKESNMGLGCGNPIAIAAIKAGETVLDLGCGGGFDCFLARKQVGETGYVIGVDMTAEMIKLARKNADKIGYTNVDFRLGEIEHLPVSDNSVDVIISNCVINLSTDKMQVFKEAFRVLKKGGRLSISDIVATDPLPDMIREDPAMVSGCIAGAENVDKIEEMLVEAGFHTIKTTPKDNSKEIIKSWFPEKNVEEYVASMMIEAVK